MRLLITFEEDGQLANKTNQASHVIRAVGMSKNIEGGESTAEKIKLGNYF